MRHTKHLWRYGEGTWKEQKVGRDHSGRNKWEFTYIQTKTRLGRKAPKGSGFPAGGRLKWKIYATQYAVKRDANTYNLIMTGVKTQEGYKQPKDKYWRKRRW